MKTVSVRELQQSIKKCVEDAQKDKIVVTQHGRPSAVIIGVKGLDWETVVLETDSRFWKLIRDRRSQPTVSLSDARSGANPRRKRA